MSRFTMVGLVMVFTLLASPAFAQDIVRLNADNPGDMGKRIHIGACPVHPDGLPRDSLAAHPEWEVRKFPFRVRLTSGDAKGGRTTGYVDADTSLVVLKVYSGPRLDKKSGYENLYQPLYILACGNPVYGSLVSVPFTPPIPEPELAQLPPAPPPPAPQIAETTYVTEQAGWRPHLDGWVGVASSHSLENGATDLWSGIFLEMPLIGDRLTLQASGSMSDANFDRFGRNTVFRDDFSASSSRLMTGFRYRPFDNLNLTLRIGSEYDHRIHGWLRGPMFEGSIEYPLGPFWNEENGSYQTRTENLWIRSRHTIPLASDGLSAWKIGAEWIRKSFQERPIEIEYHSYTTRVNGLLQRDGTWLDSRPFKFVIGAGRGSEHEGWAAFAEFGTRLF